MKTERIGESINFKDHLYVDERLLLCARIRYGFRGDTVNRSGFRDLHLRREVGRGRPAGNLGVT